MEVRGVHKEGGPLISKSEDDIREGPTEGLTRRDNRNSPLAAAMTDG